MDVRAREWQCKQCPKKPQPFDPWFYHVQHLAMLQRSGLELQWADVSRAEAAGLAAWNRFHEMWSMIGYRTITKEPKPGEPKQIEKDADGDDVIG